MLETILEEFESVLKKFKSQEFDEIKEIANDVSNDPDVVSVRKNFADFMDYGRGCLESVVSMCLDEKGREYRRMGIGLEEEPYQEVEIICKKHSHPRVLAKGLFPKNIPIEQIEFKKANLIYSPEYKEEIKNGKVICDKCNAPGEIGEILTTIILRQKVDKIEARRRIIKDVTETMKVRFGKTDKEADLRQKVLNPAIERLGFGNLYDALEATRAFAVELEHIFGVKYAALLKGPVSIHIPLPIMSITYREKDNRSLADKYILVKYGKEEGKEERHLHDLCGVRFVPYGDIKSCYEIVEIFKRKEKQGILRIVGEPDEKNRENGYRAVNVDINPYGSGLICEVQIKTNEMDTLAETDERQSHTKWSSDRRENIKRLIRENRVSEKEVYLIRLILDPVGIKGHRKNVHGRN